MVNEHNHICWGAGHHHHTCHRLTIRHLSAGYGAEADALSDVNLEITCGHRLAVMGPNGAGKSTLLNVLAGLLEARSGSILWNDQPIREARHEMAFLPQRSEVDWKFPITVRELVEMGRYPALGAWKPMGNHDRRIVDKALQTLNLEHLQKRQIGALSGGQQQRVFLARALAQEAHILLLDEPFTGLDVPGAEALSALLKTLADEGRLIIASHHDLSTAAQMFDHALLLKTAPVASGPVGEVLTPQNLQTAFGTTHPLLQS